MSWFWDGLKNKTCRYLLQRYLGQFLQEKINLEELKVDLYNGKATLKNVTLKIESLNELFEAQGWAVEVISGHVGSLTVTVPWNALMTNDSSIEISDLRISLRPIKRQNDGTSMLESMWSSVSSSMQLAEECMRQKDEDLDGSLIGNADGSSTQNNSIVGLEKFAETIDNVLNRIKAKLTNTLVRLEYPSVNNTNGIALIIDISDLDYKNETGCKAHFENIQQNYYNDMNDFISQTSDITTTKNDINYLLPTFAKHNIILEGLRLYTEEFKYIDRFSSSMNEQHSCKFDKQNLCTDESCSTRKIPIVEVKGQQKIQMKVKQSEEVNGPKVSLDMELGSFFSFLTPRQIHLLLKLYNAFSEEEKTTECMSSPLLNLRNTALMREREREQAARNVSTEKYTMSGILNNRSNWGADDYESETNNHHHHPHQQHQHHHHKENIHCAETVSSANCYDFGESLTSSMSSSSTLTGTTRFQRKIANMESCGDILNFTIKIASFTGFILHEDIVVASSSIMSNSPLNEKSQMDLLKIAEKYFAHLEEKQTDDEFKTINSFCDKNHIFLRIKPVIVNGNQQRNKNMLVLEFTAAATQFDFLEVLEGAQIPLIAFDRNENCPDGYYKRPELSLVFKSTFSCNYKEISLTMFNVTLEKSCIELDITICDRLSGLLGASPFEVSKVKHHDATDTLLTNANKKGTSSTELIVISRAFDIKLRFPIIDARPIHDAGRLPWWKQNIRTDFLLFSFNQLNLKFIAGNLDILANEINIFYCEKSLDTKIHLVKANLLRNEKRSIIEPEYEYPKISFNFNDCNDTTKYLNDVDINSDNNEQSKLPFSSERQCRTSDTAHKSQDFAESETALLPGETKELNFFCDQTMKTSKIRIKISIPDIKVIFESKQLYEIIYNRLNSDLFMWEPSPPIVKRFHQQDDFQSSNILGTSLTDTIYVPHFDRNEFECSDFLYNKNNMDNESQFFHSAQNFLRNDESTLSAADNSIYVSTYKNQQHQQQQQQQQQQQSQSQFNKNKTFDKRQQKPSNISVEIKIGKGTLAIFVPVRDNDNHVLPEQLGKFDLRVKMLKIFFVGGYKSDDHLAHLCLQLSDVEVYHCGLVPACSSINLSHLGTNIEPFMKSTFYKVPLGLTKGSAMGNNKRELLSLVIEMKKLTEQRVKRLRIAAGIQMVAFRFSPALTPHIWLNQLIDFLDVMDFPIEGYQPYGVVTELQLNLWDCAIDYRPKCLPYRAVMEIDAFTMSSNIVSTITSCNLRFIVDECILSIAPFKNFSTKYPDNVITVLPSTTLVPVLEVGLLDISIRVADKATDKCPKFDFRCSIHDIHIRTCSDSGSALAKLITHLASDGDSVNSKENETSCTSTEQSSISFDNDLFGNDEEKQQAELTKRQQERVTLLLADAVNDTVTSSNYTQNNNLLQQHLKNCSNELVDGIEVYYFPDEGKRTTNINNSNSNSNINRNNATNNISTNSLQLPDALDKELNDIINFESNVMQNNCYEKCEVNPDLEGPLPQVMADFGKLDLTEECTNPLYGENRDNDFQSLKFNSIDLSPAPLSIVDNHFSLPSHNTDLLQPPVNFPMAVMRYTLCEMTLTWHMYGGNDFVETRNIEREIKMKTEKSRMSEAYRHGVSYVKNTQDVQFEQQKKSTKSKWKSAGGPTRNHEVLVEMQFSKVRLSHEVYPTYTSQASRQVLLVNDFEIRDRLKSSEIKKFLHHPKTNLINKNHQMIVIKALHVRPNPEKSSSQECSLRISLLPLRLYIEQYTLEFLEEFFTKLSDNCATGANENNNYNNSNTLQKQQEPLMAVDDDDYYSDDYGDGGLHDLQARKLVKENLDLLIDVQKMNNTGPEGSDVGATANMTQQQKVPLAASTNADDTAPIFFREIIFSPEVQVKFDYRGRNVELSRGIIPGLLMGLIKLECSEIRLCKVVCRRGLLGFQKLIMFLYNEWLNDIKKNQVSNVLSGVGPAHPILQLFQGIFDLFWLPIEQYQKDGRIIRGLQLGAQSFTTRTALAALDLTSRIVHVLQFTAETTFDMVSPGPSVRRCRKLHKGKKKHLPRPRGVGEGLTNAYIIVKDGFNDSANTLITTAVVEHDQKGYTGAVGAVIRTLPQTVVRPVVIATQATTNILDGVKSSLVPEAHLEAREKWKDDTD